MILVWIVLLLYPDKHSDANAFFNIFSERETATTALMEGGGPRGPGRGPSGNGFFNNNCNNNLAAAAAHAAANNGGDRSRLFRKSNGSKPVREWYVWMKWMRTSAALIKIKQLVWCTRNVII